MTCVSILDVARAEAAAAAAGVGPEFDQTLPVLIDSSDLDDRVCGGGKEAVDKVRAGDRF